MQSPISQSCTRRGKRSTMSYTNDLHEALLTKDGPTFWKCRRSKFDTRASPTQVGGCVDPIAIANNFASYFSEVYAPNNRHRASSVYNEYILLRGNHFGLPLRTDTGENRTSLAGCNNTDAARRHSASASGVTAQKTMPQVSQLTRLCFKCHLHRLRYKSDVAMPTG